jgi:hypothetical protein
MWRGIHIDLGSEDVHILTWCFWFVLSFLIVWSLGNHYLNKQIESSFLNIKWQKNEQLGTNERWDTTVWQRTEKITVVIPASKSCLFEKTGMEALIRPQVNRNRRLCGSTMTVSGNIHQSNIYDGSTSAASIWQTSRSARTLIAYRQSFPINWTK